ncbi:MAG TPA: type II toxin-antitoxin system death-on-curing family toxin [Pyrinomonadaceae bacterium]|nr:type II toxin-antitoxin system death-on-curing family toxin [Pyrinomonadaceae bacterium]
MRFPDKLDVLAVHARLIAETGGRTGIRDEGLLESALAAAENRFNYEDADLVQCAATYAYHLTQAHPFVDGNKRVAAAITETFIESNGSELRINDDEVVELFLKIAAGTKSRDSVEEVLRRSIRKRNA